MRCDITVNLRGGDYLVDETIVFGPADSGPNGHSVIYRSYDGPGAARFLGAKPVTGWTRYDDNIYRAQVDPNQLFYTLFEGHQRATTARTPNRQSDDEWAPYLVSTNPDPARFNTPKWLTFIPGDWDPAWGELSDAQIVVWSGNDWVWFTDTVPIQNMSWDNNMATVRYATRYPMTSDEGGSRYFIQNSLHFLDEPGEYYLNWNDGSLYYWPRSGSIDDTTVWAPTVKTVFSFAGDSPSSRVHDVVLDGLAVEYSDFVDWYRYGWNQDGDSGIVHKYPQWDRQIELPRNRFGTITMTNTRAIELRRMHISNTGFHAVYLLFANEHNRVSDSLIEYTGGDGIKIEGPYPGEDDVAHHNTFTGNYIHHVGELVPGDAAGVEILSSGHNEVSHSVIEHSARYAVSLETRPEVTKADNYTHHNRLEYLRIAHVGKDSNDMGALYAYGVTNFEPTLPPTNVMNQITIDDVNPTDPTMPAPATHGVHMDFGGCGFHFSNIEVTNVQGNTFKGDRDCNILDNNSWDPDFDKSKMEYDNIGVPDDFPYPLPD